MRAGNIAEQGIAGSTFIEGLSDFDIPAIKPTADQNLANSAVETWNRPTKAWKAGKDIL